MNPRLLDYEWQFLLQLVSRIYCCDTYESVCSTTMQQLQTLIPFEKGVCFRTQRQNGKTEICDPVSLTPDEDYTFFLKGNYPRWAEFVMSPSSTSFRQSDLVQGERWEKSRVYREIWHPQNIYWGLFLSVVYQDQPQMLLGLFRPQKEKDFGDRELFIINMLCNALEHRLYQIGNPHDTAFGLEKLPLTVAADYSLTKREAEITDLICRGYSSEKLCEDLYISPSTLNKHLSNIYYKTGAKNRLQLVNMMLNPN